jgi:aminomethyltransferase
VKRHQLGVMLEGEEPTGLGFLWHTIYRDGQKVGDLTNCVWSYRLKKNIGFALIDVSVSAGDEVEVLKDGKPVRGVVHELPFL